MVCYDRVQYIQGYICQYFQEGSDKILIQFERKLGIFQYSIWKKNLFKFRIQECVSSEKDMVPFEFVFSYKHAAYDNNAENIYL